MECWDYVPGGMPRAPRYALPLHARYRGEPCAGWHDAKVVNVSRSGVLFSASGVIAAGTLAELHIIISRAGVHATTATVSIHCRCRIVRIERTTDDDTDVRIAGEILSSTFHRIDQRHQIQ
jgi:hypothetical protein